jgi:hypothetical protein
MSYSSPTKTVGNVQSQVKRVFGDESGVQLTNDDITRWINEAQVDIAKQNQILQTTATMAVTGGTATYSLTSVTPRIDTLGVFAVWMVAVSVTFRSRRQRSLFLWLTLRVLRRVLPSFGTHGVGILRFGLSRTRITR